jgi:hypothetical protein
MPASIVPTWSPDCAGCHIAGMTDGTAGAPALRVPTARGALPGSGTQQVDHDVEQTKPRTLVGDVERRGLGQQWP